LPLHRYAIAARFFDVAEFGADRAAIRVAGIEGLRRGP
jgi:hypothetical protein